MGIRRANYRPVYQMPASAMATPESNGAPLSRNLDIPVRLFDDTTAEYVQGSFWLPDNYDAGGDVLLTAAVEPACAETPANSDVSYRVAWRALPHGSDPGGSWSNDDTTFSDEIVTGSGMLYLHEITFTPTDWGAGRLILFKFGRNPGGGEFGGDLRLYHLTIEIPVR